MSVKPRVIALVVFSVHGQLYIRNMLSESSPFVTFPGDYGKLGHGNSQTHKAPKRIEGNLSHKVIIIVQDSVDLPQVDLFLILDLFISLGRSKRVIFEQRSRKREHEGCKSREVHLFHLQGCESGRKFWYEKHD